MKKETDTICRIRKNGSECKGALMRDHRISRMEKFMGHRKYTCDKCSASYKFVSGEQS